jgi:hypothetical protein
MIEKYCWYNASTSNEENEKPDYSLNPQNEENFLPHSSNQDFEDLDE